MDDFIKKLYLTLPRKSMEMKKRLKKTSETGKMTVESLLSLANHYGVLEQACKSVLTMVSMRRSLIQFLNVFSWICSRTCV